MWPLYFCPVVSSFFPRLPSVIVDWMSTILPHMMWHWCEFKMHAWNVPYAARWKYSMQKIAKKSPSGHHCTTLSGYIFATKAFIDNRKNLLNINVICTSPQYGELWPTNGRHLLESLGHSSKFQLVSRLGFVTAQHSSSRCQLKLRRWTEGTTYIRQGSHHVGHWPTF